jgi:SagB-type dehydrogenase family enzyme
VFVDNKENNFISGLVENYLDNRVYNDVLQTHAKESICLPDFGHVAINAIDNDILARVQFTESELSPFHHRDIECKSDDDSWVRQASHNQFSSKKIDFEDVKKWLVDTFSPDNKGRRPYPSAGGLYPAEPLVFLFKERLSGAEDLISGCYHFRPISRHLQLIETMSDDFFYSKILHNIIPKHQRPSFVVVYLSSLAKSVFKYRYRGYRHAVMEVGSMYQQAIMTSQSLGLVNTLWSSFADYELLSALNLDVGSFMPITMQLFGYPVNNNE